MEPVAASTASLAFRPAGGSTSELSAVLRHGNLVAGEVLKSDADGSVMLAIARQRVPAQTNLLLEPGQRFLLRVEHTNAGIVLHLADDGDPREQALLGALRRVIGEARPLGELLLRLAASLRAQAELPEPLRALLAGVEAQVVQPERGGGELARLLRASPLFFESMLGARDRERSRAAGTNLKALLLEALSGTEDPAARELLERTLRGLESEQLLNVARHRSGEAPVWSFLLPDAGSWTTAWLRIDPDGSAPGEDGSDELERRIVLETRFSALGFVRAEIAAGARGLDVRLAVEHAELAQRLQREADALIERLSVDGRTVSFAVRRVAPEAGSDGMGSLDIGFLERHRMLDVDG